MADTRRRTSITLPRSSPTGRTPAANRSGRCGSSVAELPHPAITGMSCTRQRGHRGVHSYKLGDGSWFIWGTISAEEMGKPRS
ncbi:MAG: hypothetical protein M1357_00680 [Candidatus Marsarchaeota archaeon]|nr:hypothetical protein [Candidatus Marsarchaeota archaeon]